MATISREKVVQEWYTLIDNAAGKGRWLLEKTEAAIKKARIPQVSCRQEDVSSGWFGEKRNYLVLTHQKLREFAMFIGATDYGEHLYVSWVVTVNPGFLKRAVSKQLSMGEPNALSMNLNIFAKHDLQAFVGIADSCVQQQVQELMDDIKQDYSQVNKRSKGFLSMW